MRNKNLLYVIMGLVGLFCFAGIYDAVLTGKLGQIVIDGPPGYNGYVGVVRRVIPKTDVSLGESGNVLRVKPCLHIDAVE